MSSGRRPIHVLAAVVLPLLVLLLGAWVVAPGGGVSADAAAFNRSLALREPEVIVLGSSLANRGVDVGLLAKSLEIPENKVLVMQMPHASASHWYALLKNRVFANGHRPKLVLVVDAMTSMLNHDLLQMPSNVDRLVGQLTADEPVIAKKIFRMEDPEEFRTYFIRQHKGELRGKIIGEWRDLVLGALFGGKGKGDLQKLIERVNEEVFSNEQMDYELHAKDADDNPLTATVVPNTETGDYDLERDALLPEMQALCDEFGANLFYVRIPLPPSNAEMDYVPEDVEARAVVWMEELGSGWLDMRALDLDDSYFEDMRHLSRQGSQLFSGALARVLAALRAMEAGAGSRVIKGLESPEAKAAGAAPPVPVVGGAGCRREAPAGAWAALSADVLERLGDGVSPLVVREGGVKLGGRAPGDGCVGGAWIEGGKLIVSPKDPGATVEVGFEAEPVSDGDAVRWIPPGTSVSYTFADPWGLPENAFRIYARGFAVGGADVPISVSLGGESFNLRNQSGRVTGEGKLPIPTEPGWTLTVTVPEGGPFLMLHHLAIGVPPSTAYVLGKAESLHGMSVRVVGGRVEDTQHEAVFDAEPPPLPFVLRVRRGSKTTGVFMVEKLSGLADSETIDAVRPNKCTPLRVLEDGEPLPLPHSPCHEVRAKGEGRTCFAGDVLAFTSTDGSDPLTNGKAYTLALTPRRLCDVYGQKNSAFLRDSWWLYPGDGATWNIPPEETAAFRDGANVLEVEVIPHLAPTEAPLTVQLLADGVVKLERTLAPVELGKRYRATWELDEPLPPRAGHVSVRIVNPSAKSFALVTQITLAEDYNVFSGGSRGVKLDASAVSRTLDPVLTRTGTPDPMPEVRPGGKAQQGAHEVKLFTAWPVSDSYLEKLGLPLVSPLRLFVNGAELSRVTDRKRLKGDCDGCFYHTGSSVWFSHAGADKDSEVRAELNPVFPMVAEDGSRGVWVYPGTAVSFTLPDPWRGKAVRVAVEGYALNAQKERVGAGLIVEVGAFSGGFSKSGPEGLMEAGLEAESSAPPVVTVRSEVGSGSFLLLRQVRIQDDQGVGVLLDSPPPQAHAPAEDAGPEGE